MIIKINEHDVLIDDDTVALLRDTQSPYISAQGYPVFVRKRRKVVLHRLILGLHRGDGKQADHINGNKLDNRRENLRVCNNHENSYNKNKYVTNTSGYKGVTFDRGIQKYKAAFSFRYKYHVCYYSKCPRECAYAYGFAVSLVKPTFAKSNVVDLPAETKATIEKAVRLYLSLRFSYVNR